MGREPLIEFRQVSKSFGDRTILEKVDLQIFEGDVTTVIGLSGTGKSVMLKHIIGLLKPTFGEILFRGKSLARMTRQEWYEYMGKVSYMFQNNALFDSMSVFDNIALPLRQTTNLSRRQIEQRVMARIEQAELMEVAHKYPSEISGGMQKRTALARALVTDPHIVLFDEPTTGQDPIRKNAILSMVADYKKRFGFTAVLISHDIPDVFFISNRILALYDKKIVFQGSPAEFEEFNHPFINELIRSLEGLERELTDLYSRRHFKIRYQTELVKRNQDQTYAVVIFTFENMELIRHRIGHDVAEEIIRSLGAYISKHFGAVGGFSTRQTIDEYATVLPFSDLDEAERIVGDFIKEFEVHIKNEVFRKAREKMGGKDCIEFKILAGLAQGQPQVELESIMQFARFNQKVIATFSCKNLH